MSPKQRLSASVDAELVAVAQEAVAAGQAESMSAWVSDALRLKADHDRRLRALDHFLAAYEAEHGEVTDEEMGEDAPQRARPCGRGAGHAGAAARGKGAPWPGCGLMLVLDAGAFVAVEHAIGRWWPS